jgi:hypothetical protein
MFSGTQNDLSRKNPLLGDKNDVSFNSLIYIINEYGNFSFSRKKENSIEKLGVDVGARLYEGIFFTSSNLMSEKKERKIKILDILNYIKYNLWPVLFNKQATGLESFIGERKSETGEDIKEYVIYDIDPIYNLRYTKENFVFKFFGFVLKGFLNYAGFPCKVLTDINNEKGKSKCEFIIFFEPSVFKNEN